MEAVYDREMSVRKCVREPVEQGAFVGEDVIGGVAFVRGIVIVCPGSLPLCSLHKM